MHHYCNAVLCSPISNLYRCPRRLGVGFGFGLPPIALYRLPYCPPSLQRCPRYQPLSRQPLIYVLFWLCPRHLGVGLGLACSLLLAVAPYCLVSLTLLSLFFAPMSSLPAFIATAFIAKALLLIQLLISPSVIFCILGAPGPTPWPGPGAGSKHVLLPELSSGHGS